MYRSSLRLLFPLRWVLIFISIFWCIKVRAEDTELVSTGPLSVSGIGQWFFSMIGVLALIFALAYFMKKSRFVKNKSGRMNIISQLSLGTKERIVEVAIEDRTILVGVGQGAVTYLCDLKGEFQGSLEQASLKAEILERLDDKVAKAVDKAVNANLARISKEVLEAAFAKAGSQENLGSNTALAPKKAFKVPNEQDAAGFRTPTPYDKGMSKDEITFAEALKGRPSQKSQAASSSSKTADDEFQSFNDLKPIPGIKDYTVVNPHSKAARSVKPYEFVPLPSASELLKEKLPPYEDLPPSLDFRPVDKELMQRLEKETMPKPEDAADDQGRPVSCRHYDQVRFKRHIIGSSFLGRGFIG